MNSSEAFIKDIKCFFTTKGNDDKEKMYIYRLISSINEFLSDYPNSTYDELVDKFGTPKDIYMNYLEIIDSDELLKKIKKRNITKRTCFIIITLVIVLGLWKGYLIYQDASTSTSQIPTYIEITSPEELSNIKISN